MSSQWQMEHMDTIVALNFDEGKPQISCLIKAAISVLHRYNEIFLPHFATMLFKVCNWFLSAYSIHTRTQKTCAQVLAEQVQIVT